MDAGALIALEKGNPRLTALLDRAAAHKIPLAVPANVIAQAWRGSPRQARLARLLNAPEVEIVPVDGPTARAIGVLCGPTAVSDVVDVSVVLCARERGHTLVTSDPDDLRGIDSTVPLIRL